MEDGVERCLQQKPAFSSCRKSERTRLIDAVCNETDYWLEENARRRLKRLHKQWLKRQDIHRVLIEKGYDFSFQAYVSTSNNAMKKR